MEVEEDEIESHHPSQSQSQSPSSSQSPPPPPQQQPEPPPSPSPISSLQPHKQEHQSLAATTPPPPPQTITLALPIQQPRPTASTPPPPPSTHHTHAREDCWSEGATSTLVDAWGERYLELSRGNLKQKHWKDVADIVTSRDDYTKSSKTDVQCKNRIDTLKKKYKMEKNKMDNSGLSSKWCFYDRLGHLIGPNNSVNAAVPPGGAGGSGVAVGGKVPLAIPVHLVKSEYPSQNLNLNLNHHQQQKQQQQQQQRQQQRQQRGPAREQKPVDSESSGEEPVYDDDSPDSTDSLPPETDYVRKRPRLFARRACPMPSTNSVPVRGGGGGGGGLFREQRRISGKKRSGHSGSGSGGDSSNWKNSIMELTRVIVKFGEAYEQIETSKLQQVVEMEQQRMEFMKELELQRMRFFMKTQVDLSQVKHGRRGGGNGHRHNNNHNSNNNNMDNGDNSG